MSIAGLTNDQLTNLSRRLVNADETTIYLNNLGPQFYWSNGLLFANDLSTGGFQSGENIILTVDSSKLVISVNSSLTNIACIDMSIGASVTHQEGRISWNVDDHTINIDTEVNDVALQVGQEQLARAVNRNGTPILNGQPVFVSSASGFRPEIKLANASSILTSMTTVGLATHSIGNNNTGYINTFGLVRDVNTSLWDEGDLLWVGTTDGSLSNVRPTSPNYQFAIGMVIRKHAVNGSIFVRPTWVPRLSFLSDVSIGYSRQDGDCIRWSDDTSTWIAKKPSISYGSVDSSSLGNPGEIVYDASYLYVCTSTNVWGRVLLDFNF